MEIASSNPAFSTLVAALQAADLVDALSGDGPFTVFAPTNNAFAALPNGTLDDLLNRVRDDMEETAKVEQFPRLEGRQMLMVLAPK